MRTGTTWTQQQKLTASDHPTSGNEFGTSVAISGDTVLVGASSGDAAFPFAGSAYVFVRNGSTWSEQQKLIAADFAAYDSFGYSVAISGDTAVVGADQDDDNGGDSGSAYVFVRSGSSWSQQQKLTASDGAQVDWFGGSVAISGDRIAVGSSRDDDRGADSGSVYIFVRSGLAWTEDGKITASDGRTDDGFGSVAVDGDIVVVGAAKDDRSGVNSGSAYVFMPPPSDLTVLQESSPDSAVAGELLTYTLAVTNEGPSKAVGVTLADALPAGVTFLSAVSTQGSCGELAGTVTCAIGDMTWGATTTAVIQVSVAGSTRSLSEDSFLETKTATQ